MTGSASSFNEECWTLWLGRIRWEVQGLEVVASGPDSGVADDVKRFYSARCWLGSSEEKWEGWCI